MNTLVVNGEPLVYGESWAPSAFRRLLHDVTNDEQENPMSERIQELLKQARQEEREFVERPTMNVTANRFQFVAQECCANNAWEEKHDREYTVPVVRKSKWGHTYTGERRLPGCRCQKCSDDSTLFNAYKFIQEVTGVKFEI